MFFRPFCVQNLRHWVMNLHSRLETVVGIVRSVTLSAGGEYPEGSTSWLSKFRAKFLLVIWMKNVYFYYIHRSNCAGGNWE